MPLHFTRKSIFDNNPSVIINTANCIGVMGKGIADQISRRYPGVKAHFAILCGKGLSCSGVPDRRYNGTPDSIVPPCIVSGTPCHVHRFHPGDIAFSPTGLRSPRWIMHLPTKRHWKDKSDIADVRRALQTMGNRLADQTTPITITMPPPGCGNGGLRWSDVRPIVEQALARASENHTIYCSEPGNHQ